MAPVATPAHLRTATPTQAIIPVLRRRRLTPPAPEAAPGHVPPRSRAQRMSALAKGNVIRKYRAQLKRDLKAGRVKAIDILTEPSLDPRLDTMKLYDLVLAVPKVGRVKANKTLAQCRISPSKTLGGMTQRQRNELVSYLH